jgi:ElaB/YqjD/DUF883 family membrane-anchored ribosome-binding protein
MYAHPEQPSAPAVDGDDHDRGRRSRGVEMQLFRRNRSDRMSDDMSAVMAQQASAATQQAQRLVDEGVEQASRALATAREQGAQVAEDASEALGEWRANVESMVRAQPVTALALAALAGLAVGALLRSGEK